MILLSALMFAADIKSDPASIVHLERVEARLFYEETGRLSDDLLARSKPFEGWNTNIGEGDAEEFARDILVTARLESSDLSGKVQQFATSPAEIVVRDGKGMLIGSRKWNSIFMSVKGVAVLPLWLSDVTCAGDLKITAIYKGSVKTASLKMHCGE